MAASAAASIDNHGGDPPLLHLHALAAQISALVGGADRHLSIIGERMSGAVAVFHTLQACAEHVLCRHVDRLLIGSGSGIHKGLGAEDRFSISVIGTAKDGEFGTAEIIGR